MKKVFTKIAGLSVGLALAIGVGVAVGGRETARVDAAEVVEYTLDGTVTGTGSGYNADNSVTQDGKEWTVNGNTTTNPWRIGGNKNNGTDPNINRYMYSNAALSTADITKVVFIAGSTVSITINSFKLIVSSEAKGAGTVTDELTGTVTASQTTTFTKPTGHDWSSKFFTFVFNVSNSTTSAKYIQFNKAEFYKESSTPRGELVVNNFTNPVLTVGATNSLSYTFTPASGDTATLTSHTWTSSDADVLSIDGDTYKAVASGVVILTLTGTDSNSEQYSVKSNKIFVTKSYSFEIGNNVALYCGSIGVELSGISTTNTKYGIGESYATDPTGVYALTIEEGDVAGSFSFKNDSNYLFWASGNSLNKTTTKNANASWYVVEYDDHMDIHNAFDSNRRILWNNSSGQERFASYESGSYENVSLAVIEDVPVRGTISISNPTVNILAQNATGTAAFTWTPAEGSEATISSYTWTSSNSDVISISGDKYTAEESGKAKLTLNATDSNGQEYVASTNDITVVAVVSGDYEKVTSVKADDVVAIVCESAKTEFSGLNGKIGDYVFYETAPASVCDLTLKAGASTGTFALQNSDGKYLAWTSSAELEFADEITAKGSWTITFDDGNAIITNSTLDGDTARYLAWNNSSPRFCAYKSGQTSIQLYAPVEELDASTIAFANKIISDITCDASGKTAPSTSAWEDLEEDYADVTPTGKSQLASITSAHHENPTTDREVVEEALAKYDYIVGKYGKTTYKDFLGRNPSPITNGVGIVNKLFDENSTPGIIVVVVTVVVLGFSLFLVLKKTKKQ